MKTHDFLGIFISSKLCSRANYKPITIIDTDKYKTIKGIADVLLNMVKI